MAAYDKKSTLTTKLGHEKKSTKLTKVFQECFLYCVKSLGVAPKKYLST